MKLCQKCIDAILLGLGMDAFKVEGKLWFDRGREPVETVSESECEFWAHKELLTLFDTHVKTLEHLQKALELLGGKS